MDKRSVLEFTSKLSRVAKGIRSGYDYAFKFDDGEINISYSRRATDGSWDLDRVRLKIDDVLEKDAPVLIEEITERRRKDMELGKARSSLGYEMERLSALIRSKETFDDDVASLKEKISAIEERIKSLEG